MKGLTGAERAAAALRDETLADLLAGTSAWDRALVRRAVLAYGREHATLSANDVRPLLPEMGRSLVGVVFRALACSGVLVHTGEYVPSTSPATKGHRIAEYALAPVEREAAA